MKKIVLLFTTVLAFTALHAQWVNDPVNNTIIAHATNDAGEVYTAIEPVSGDIYVQWTDGAANGWSPTLQRLNSEGVPQWGSAGIHINEQSFASWSQGIAIAATTDNAVVTCFSTDAGQSYAVKINADGTFAWGEAGILLFNGGGGSRTEVIAGDDGGVWTLGSDNTHLFLQYVNADGSLNPMVTIADNGGQSCMFGQLTLSNDNRVFVTYEKLGSGYYTNKQVFVAGYNPDGSPFSEETLLMSSQTFQSTYIHHVLADGMGGGYVYIWHPGIGNAHNTYVFHFDQFGANTLSSLNGASVHSTDPNNYYIDAYATVDPVSHDLVIVYEQTDAAFQSESRVYANRFNNIGERLWNEGILIVEENGSHHSDLLIDAFDYGGGYGIIYNEGDGYNSTVKAIGIDDAGNQLWTTTMSSNSYSRAMCDNSTGYHEGQNIIAWVNENDGNIYAQNIGTKGEMGEVDPPTPPTPCYPPTNFTGEYYYSEMGPVSSYGAQFSWNAPETTPLHYNLYCEGLRDTIAIDPQNNSYLLELECGDYIFRLTAVYEDCESDYALTESGDNYLFITVTSTPENTDEEIVTVTKVYTLTGQLLRDANPETLSRGIYIIQGLTRNGQLVTRKKTVNF